MKIKLNIFHTALILLSMSLLFGSGCSKKESSSAVTSTTENSTSTDTSDNTTSTFAVSEITQGIEGGYYTGSFSVPLDGVSFILSVFKDNNGSTAFYSLSDPDDTDILSSSSTPTLSGAASGSSGSYGYANVLVPQTPSFSAKAGTWTFKAYNNDRVKLALRSGSTPSSTTIVVQPYITGTTWVAGDLSDALSIMSSIYSAIDGVEHLRGYIDRLRSREAFKKIADYN